MDTDYKDIKIFIYDNELKKRAIQELSALINNFCGKCDGFILNRGWVQGAHLQIAYRNFIDINEEKNFIDKIYKKVAEWKQVKSEEIDYAAYENYVERVKILENYKSDVLPLRKQFSIVVGKYDKQRELFPESYFFDEEIRTKVVTSLSKHYYDLPKADQEVFILKLMTLYGNYRNATLSKDEGVYLAYYSFKSHYEGFANGLNNFHKEKRNEILFLMQPDTTEINDFINSGFSEFLQYSVSGFAKYLPKERKIFNEFIQSIDQLESSYNQLFEQGAIKIAEENTIKNYVGEEDISDYHKKIKGNFDLELFNTQDFIVGRLIMNWFYGMLPILSVSPLKKHKLCHLMSLAVEKDKGKDTCDLLAELKEKYQIIS